ISTVPCSMQPARAISHAITFCCQKQLHMTDQAVAIIMPSHNRRDTLLKCLDHVARLQGTHKAFVVVVGSTDGTSDAVRAQYPEAVLIEGKQTLWWSGAINAGLEESIRQGF